MSKKLFSLIMVLLCILVLSACSQTTPTEALTAEASGGEIEHTMDGMSSGDTPFDAQFNV